MPVSNEVYVFQVVHMVFSTCGTLCEELRI